MTEHPGPSDASDASDASDDAGPAGEDLAPARRRVRRRASRPGTNPAAEDGPDLAEPREGPVPGETQHDRWLREQRPPHWE